MDKRQIFINCLEYKICTDENLKKSIPFNEAYRNLIDGLIVGINNHKKLHDHGFLTELHKLYATTNFPLLNNSLLISIYSKWCNNPIIFDCIIFLNKSIKKPIIQKNELFWSLVIRHVHIISSTDYNQLKIKLRLLAFTVNLFLSDSNLLDYSLLFRAILFEDNLKKTYYGSQKTIISKIKPIYRFFENVFLILKKRNASPEVCRNFFEEFYSKYNSKIFLENNFLSFIDKLLSKIHLNHILSLNFSGYEKLYFIYCVNPIMIDRISPSFMLEPTINSKKSFVPFFLSYDLILDIFSNYYISYFFTANFFTDKLNEHEKEWLIDLLKGKNLVYSKNLPFKLTKKQVHFFNSTSKDYNFTVTQGLIFNAILLKTGDIDYAIKTVPFIRDLRHCDFWIETLSYLYKMKSNSKNNQEVDIVNLLDYINNEAILLGRKLDLKNLKWEKIIEDSAEWHHQLNISKSIKGIKLLELPISKIDNFNLIFNNKVYSIIQLKTNKELIIEGSYLKHCVGSYCDNCLNGNTFIFSLRLRNKKTIERLITIEVNNDVIIQARGNTNRDCNDIENEVIKKWAEVNKLEINLNKRFVW